MNKEIGKRTIYIGDEENKKKWRLRYLHNKITHLHLTLNATILKAVRNVNVALFRPPFLSKPRRGPFIFPNL